MKVRSFAMGQDAPVLQPHPAIGRASAAFAVTFLQLARAATSGDFIDAIIRLAIVDGNTRFILADDAANRRYAGFVQAPPEHLRRPITLRGLSDSLSLPFETVRRRVKRLAAKDMCIAADGGVIISAEQLEAAGLQAFQAHVFNAVRRLNEVLVACAPAFARYGRSDPRIAPLPSDPPPYRAVGRAALSYVLRYLEATAPVAGSLLDGIVLLHLFTLNVADHLGSRDAVMHEAAASELLDDASRRRVSVYGLALGMGLSSETARRRIAALEARGLCRRDRGGVYVPSAALRSPAFLAYRDRNLASLQRLFAELHHAGVQLADV